MSIRTTTDLARRTRAPVPPRQGPVLLPDAARPTLGAGAHTLQIGGVTTDGELLGRSLGVEAVHGAAATRRVAAVSPVVVVRPRTLLTAT